MACILLLGPERPEFDEYLENRGMQVVRTEEPLPGKIDLDEIDFIVSFGYRHIIRRDVLDRFPGRAINLHISLLPWNRGSDPNLWSYLENSPKGVSIHHIDEGMDTGDLLVQKTVAGGEGDTLRISYERLIREISALFFENWPLIYKGELPGKKQSGPGSSHRLRDKEPYMHLLTDGWDTPVERLVGKAYPRS